MTTSNRAYASRRQATNVICIIFVPAFIALDWRFASNNEHL